VLKIFLCLGIFFFLLSCDSEPDSDIPVRDVVDTDFQVTINDHGNVHSPLSAVITSLSKHEHRLEITIRGKYENDLLYTHDTLTKTHSVPLIGLYPGFNNTIDVKAYNASHQQIAARSLEFQTDSLDLELPGIEILHREESHPGSRLTFVEYRKGITNLPFIFDEYGEVRWYLKYENQSLIRPSIIKNSSHFYCGDFGNNVFYQFDWLGNKNTHTLPDGFKMLHHDVYRHRGHLFFPSDQYSILECDEQGKLIKSWNVDKIVRNYLPENQSLASEGKDWLHINSVHYQEDDASLLVSARNSLGVFKLDYITGDIRWILNDTAMLWYSYPGLKELALIPHEGCELPIGQHSPVLLPDGDILMLDNGYDGYERLKDEDGLIAGGKAYSRLVIYQVDPEKLTVSQVFEFGREYGKDLYSRFAGNAGFDPETGSCYGLFGKIVKTEQGLVEGRVIEAAKDGELLFDARLTGKNSEELFYRSEKINLNEIINSK
jgi:arylsulfate sulfotransferase